ncbi:nuclear transport factor 2 family protein [uncultured Tateyamaria sp.]|uniref:nuclear transport factor 2 family protein n=1 Tax=uncultured Tateyamaria sp. TaxID=455651 RepID=UPI0026124FC2|nr:nuclear transport factor 2 family protein [uncultured Tateyamaria sp.]
MPHKIETLRTYFDEVWVKGNVDALKTVLAPDARTRGIMGEMPFAVDDMVELVSMVRELLGPITVDIPVTVDQGDWLSAVVEIKSHAAHSGDPVHVFNHMIVRFDGPKMIELYSGVDSLMLFEQLGLMPENALAIMLGGTRLQ